MFPKKDNIYLFSFSGEDDMPEVAFQVSNLEEEKNCYRQSFLDYYNTHNHVIFNG